MSGCQSVSQLGWCRFFHLILSFFGLFIPFKRMVSGWLLTASTAIARATTPPPPPLSLKTDSPFFRLTLQSWREAKSSEDIARITPWCTSGFTELGKMSADWKLSLLAEVKQQASRETELRQVSYQHWTDTSDTMVVTFSGLVKNTRTG